jgi:hypothetical protein
VSDEAPRVVDHVIMRRLTAEEDALSQLVHDLRRAGFHVSPQELALHLHPPTAGLPVTIAGQEYLAQPRTDGQPGLRLVHRLSGKPEREHR